MKDKLPLLLIAIAFWEVLIFVYSGWVTEDITMQYRLAARYSARTSHTIVLVALIMMSRYGLTVIFSEENKRKWFYNLLALFSLNHIIHFYFLATNFRVNQMELLSPRTLGGGTVYVFIIIMPFLIYNSRTLTKAQYIGILAYFSAVLFVILKTFSDRITMPLPNSTPLWFYYMWIGLFSILILFNIKTVITDFKKL